MIELKAAGQSDFAKRLEAQRNPSLNDKIVMHFFLIYCNNF